MEKIDKAIRFAAKAHEGQTRKGGNQPYIFHPLEVLNLVSQMTLEEDVLCAAVLHDTVEDTDTTIFDIKREFGDRVAKLVYFESEDKRSGESKEATWQIRKQETINTISSLDDLGAKMVCLGDKLSNLRSFHLLILQNGEDAWNNFNMKDPLMHHWYYDSLRVALEDLKDYAIYKEYCFLIHTVFDRYLGDENGK